MFQFRFDDPMNMGPYDKNLKCYPVVMMAGKERIDVERGGKIILPASALDHLTRLHIQFPMLFKLTNKSKNRATHCGVLEFIAEEGRCYLPYWMMRNLCLGEGEIIQVQYVNLPIAKFAKFQPQSVDFLEISNPKAVLENSLRNFATLTTGDVVSINYNDKDYELCILETRPGNAVSIIECDMDVDFAPPVGYEEPTRTNVPTQPQRGPRYPGKERKISEGVRLDGKEIKHKNKSEENEATTSKSANRSSKDEEEVRGVPNYDYKPGVINLNRNFLLNRIEDVEMPKQNENINKGQKLKHIGVRTA